MARFPTNMPRKIFVAALVASTVLFGAAVALLTYVRLCRTPVYWGLVFMVLWLAAFTRDQALARRPSSARLLAVWAVAGGVACAGALLSGAFRL